VLSRTADFVHHYGTAMLPARPRKPQDKAKVETGVLIVERWILARLRNHRFYSLGELNKAIKKLVADLNDRPFKKLPGTRRSGSSGWTGQCCAATAAR
jgi:transposase